MQWPFDVITHAIIIIWYIDMFINFHFTSWVSTLWNRVTISTSPRTRSWNSFEMQDCWWDKLKGKHNRPLWVAVQGPFTARPLYIHSYSLLFLLWLYIHLFDLGRFFSLLILYSVCRTPWIGDQPFTRPLPTHRATQIQNKSTHTSMPWVGFEPTISVLEQAKTVYVFDWATTVICFRRKNNWKV
jgi:hypothetical protein